MDPSLPLARLRVIDCSRVLAGPFATMLLADLGADVVKLEPPAGDESRGWGPPWWGDPADRRSAYFASVNRNKRSVVVDLRTEEGHRLLHRLADGAELLVHNARPASASRLGLDAEALRARHPRLIVASVGGFIGSEAALPAYDLLAQAMSGLMAVTGERGGPPQKVGVAVLDLLAGLQLAVGALASLLGRVRGGDAPTAVSVSLMESSVAALTNVLANHLASGQEPERWGNEHPNIVPYQVFATRDGHVAVAVGNDAQYARLLHVLGLEADERHATNAGRVADRAALVPWLATAIASHDRDDLVAALRHADVPAGPVRNVGEALGGMEDALAGAWVQEAGAMRLAPDPIRLSGEQLPLRREPPTLGQHTGEVLRELGLEPPELDQLRQAGIIA